MPVILAVQEMVIRRITWAKSSTDPISTNQKVDMLVQACHPSYAGRSQSKPAEHKSMTLEEK
jgi:hypothetical protein